MFCALTVPFSCMCKICDWGPILVPSTSPSTFFVLERNVAPSVRPKPSAMVHCARQNRHAVVASGSLCKRFQRCRLAPRRACEHLCPLGIIPAALEPAVLDLAMRDACQAILLAKPCNRKGSVWTKDRCDLDPALWSRELQDPGSGWASEPSDRTRRRRILHCIASSIIILLG